MHTPLWIPRVRSHETCTPEKAEAMCMLEKQSGAFCQTREVPNRCSYSCRSDGTKKSCSYSTRLECVLVPCTLQLILTNYSFRYCPSSVCFCQMMSPSDRSFRFPRTLLCRYSGNTELLTIPALATNHRQGRARVPKHPSLSTEHGIN